MAPNNTAENQIDNAFLLNSVLQLEDYDINPETGFLPSTPPLKRLPNPYFEPWESIIDIYHDLMLVGRLRECVLKLPVLETDRLETTAEYRRVFLILSILAHGYVWGKFEAISEILPACIAIPWVKVSDYLGVAPICNHAAVVMWNWRLIFPDGPLDLSNLATLLTFSNTGDESWFYLVTTAIESLGGRALTAIVSAIKAVRDQNNHQLLMDLRVIRSVMAEITTILQRMFEKCDPYVFYYKVRPYLSGWENEDRLPNGLIYEGVDPPDANGNPIYRQYVGGSAGQSGLIQAIDIALNVEHFPTGLKASTVPSDSNKTNNVYTNGHSHCQCDHPAEETSKVNIKPQQPYLYKIRQNIPEPHRRFLEDLAKVANIRSYILSETDENPNGKSREDLKPNELTTAYNECLNELKNFRNKHLQIVSVYIVIQAHRASGGLHFNSKNVVSSVNKELYSATSTILINNAATPSQTIVNRDTHKVDATSVSSIKGTGGTNLIPFLKQMRDETTIKEILD